jgi:hypothetical protein
MKFLEILLSFLGTQGKAFLQSNTEALTQAIVNNARRVAGLLSGVAVSITLLCVGFSMGFHSVVESYKNGGSLEFSAGLVAGILLTAASLGALLYFLSEKAWLKATGLQAQPAVAESSGGPGLDTAIAVLILEISQELKSRREKTADSPAQQN